MKFLPRKKSRRIALAAAVALAGCGVALFAMPHPPSGPPQKDMAVDKAVRAETVEAAAAQLEKGYVYPDKGMALARMLRDKLHHGGYDGIDSAEAFARALTDDMRRDSHDRHLEVLYFEDEAPAASAQRDAEQQADELKQGRYFNFGFENVDRLKGDLGYIDLREFSRPAQAGPRIEAAMGMLADTRGLVIDLRQCGGGDPDTVMLFASYLFDKPIHLNDIIMRDEPHPEERWTTATVPGQRYGQSRPVYLLTSADTFSGCEDFAYGLKYAGRATIVGETTGGGAHPGGPQRLGAHFQMFLPGGRSLNPVTHTDWEGVGVKPDVETSAKASLDTAQLQVLKRLVAVERDPQTKRRMQSRIDDLE